MLSTSGRWSFDRALPRRTQECDVWSLDLTPFDAFVLSSIDGGVDVVELAEIVGAPIAETERTIARLIALGAVQLSEPASADLFRATADWHSAR
jgi:hypothetical protein